MSGAPPDHLDVQLYLQHFPPAGDVLAEGTSKAVHGLAAGLVQCGARVTVLCENERASRMRSQHGYEIACFEAARGRFQGAIGTELRQHAKSLPPRTIVVLNGAFHPSVAALSRVLRKANVPYIAAPHDPYHPAIFRRRAYLKWPYWHLMERPMLRNARAVQVLDARHAQFLRALRIETPVIESLNGFTPEDVCQESSLQWSEDGPAKLFFLGRLDAYNKGLDLLLEAVADLHHGADARLVIQGPDWGDGARLRRQARRLHLNGHARFCEPDYGASPASLIAGHDIFCLPSRFEGFGLSAIEAMLAGRVLLVSDIAGVAPHVRACGCGIVVTPQRDTIRDGLSELLARRADWKTMGLAGRHYALERLRWPAIAAAAMRDYQKAIA